MVGGGPFQLKPGQWTDDTSMALCLAESLLTKNGFNAADQMGRYLNWWQWGYLSSTGECFDIGTTVSQALAQYQQTAEPFAGSTDPYSAGNGSLMRLAPVVLFYFPDARQIQSFAADSSRTTHAAPEAIECCQLFAGLIARALEGATKADLRQSSSAKFSQPKVTAMARGDYLGKTEADIKGSGYSVQSLEAALWCFQQTDSFAAAILLAANLGDDADTTAAITGQLAGAYYGVRGIPEHWLERLHDSEEIAATADRLLDASRLRQPE
jgi:ADP-ribosyl-[dinitrogen reductase] hydrolase